jgi:molybdopterin synthase sulfur carrier subunit
MKVNIIYFASLRDQSQKSTEHIETDARTAQQLFEELNMKYSFKVTQENLRVAINENYCDFSTSLSQNDTIVFIPPVAGG